MRFYLILCAIPLTLLAQPMSAHCTGKCCSLKKGDYNRGEYNMGYVQGIPMGDMGRNINLAHSVGLRGFYGLPANKGRTSVGLDVTAGSYASFTRTQTFGMNGVETPVEVNYNSNLTTYSAILKQDIFRSGPVNVFVAAKAGMAKFASEIVIEDPEVPDGCEALDRERLITDFTWIAGAQTGVSVDMVGFFSKLPPQTLMLQAYVGYVQGGNVDYINVRNGTTDNHSGHSHTTTNDGSKPLDVRFVNLQTNTMHTHEVARVYSSPMQMLECGISLVMKF